MLLQSSNVCSVGACIYEVLFKLSFVAAELTVKLLKNKKSFLLKDIKKSNISKLQLQDYAGFVEIENFSSNANLVERLVGRHVWLCRLLENEK